MSFPRYESYKDSGVEWLGEVPSHWKLHKLKNVARFSGGGTPDRAREDFWGGNIPWVSPKDMKTERLCDSEEYITKEGLDESASSLLAPGAVLMVVRSGILKHSIPVALNDLPVALNQDLKAIRFGSPHTARFFQRWVQGHVHPLLLEWAKQGATVESIEQEYLCNTLLPLPGEDEQSAIADFLDRETAKIDALVEAQRRLIALLKEKRQAVISHAVTKGLDPSAPMKPSGIDWLGDVPAHWTATRLKFLGAFGAGAGFPHEEQGVEDEELNFYKVGSLGSSDDDGYLIQSGNTISRSVASKLRAFIFAPDTIVFAKIGAALMLGRFRLLRADACIDNNMMGFICHPENDANFMRYICEARVIFGAIVNPGAVPSLSESDISDTPVAVPSLKEQQAITRVLVRRLKTLSDLLAGAEKSIALLTERRAVLISAAVTGKIDVRGVAAAAQEPRAQ